MKAMTTLSIALLLGVGTLGAVNAQEQPQAEALVQSNLAVGDSVYNSEGEEIGTIEEVMAEADGSEEVIISVGEFLGLGGKQVALSADELTPRDEGGFSVGYTTDQLEAMPEYDPNI